MDYNANSFEGFKVLGVTRRSCESGEIISEDLPVEVHPSMEGAKKDFLQGRGDPGPIRCVCN